MFIRAKTIKGQAYAYLVKNQWKKGQGTRQKVSEYLGKIVKINGRADDSFLASLKYPDLYLKKTPPKKMLFDFLEYKIEKLGFQKGELMTKEDISISLKDGLVMQGKKHIVLGINSDFLCNYTLRQLINFKTQKGFDGAGLDFARAFVATGLPVEEEFFVHLFKKVFQPGGNSSFKS
jgi:hypothetical protein